MTADHCALVETLSNNWRDALCAKDMDRLRELVHPDFKLIGSRLTGAFTMSRDEWLEAIQRREIVGIDIHVQDASVFDNVVVGTIEANWRVSYRGNPIQDCVLLTDVWICEDGEWRVIRRHSSPIPASECLAGAK